MGIFNELLNLFIPGRHMRQIDRDPRWSNAQTFQYQDNPELDEERRVTDIGYAERRKAESDRANSLED